MNSYQKWSPQDRTKSLKLYNKAKKMGLLVLPTKCRRCGQEEGTIEHHNHNYDISLEVLPKIIDGCATQEDKDRLYEVLEPLCWRCHFMFHNSHRWEKKVAEYFERVRKGEKFPPMYRRKTKPLKKTSDSNL